jgi:hypothetical protein
MCGLLFAIRLSRPQSLALIALIVDVVAVEQVLTGHRAR